MDESKGHDCCKYWEMKKDLGFNKLSLPMLTMYVIIMLQTPRDQRICRDLHVYQLTSRDLLVIGLSFSCQWIFSWFPLKEYVYLLSEFELCLRTTIHIVFFILLFFQSLYDTQVIITVPVSNMKLVFCIPIIMNTIWASHEWLTLLCIVDVH